MIHLAKATNILWEKTTVGCRVGQNAKKALEGKSWLRQVGGIHTTRRIFKSEGKYNITYLSSPVEQPWGCGVGSSTNIC